MSRTQLEIFFAPCNNVSQALKFIPVEARLSGRFSRSANEGKVNGEKVPTLNDNSLSNRMQHISGKAKCSYLLNLNKTEWVQINMNPVYTSTTIYRKIPGSLLIGLAYRFSEAKEEPATMIIYN